ncbi:hypothetical protein CHS0354_033852 [Potamilus streckersoni]|uniref:Neurotransmitter-gated ion-channel ligand-binding domain-containing protein n=1 Tax=Potamilus streckersoni TaxID=2493646 RepID=A0AAE0RWT7_9BIVA|nr:hypothetical protein CHS0354_033852 [Potamilus streckersoni]
MKINLDSNGQLIWEPGIVMQTICEISITKYPFDKQHCSLRRNKVDTTGYYPNGEWDITDTEVRLYSPEDGSYNSGEILPGAEAVIKLRRKPIFYILSTILPIAMLSVLNLLVFLLPPNTGEKITLAVTVLLSFTHPSASEEDALTTTPPECLSCYVAVLIKILSLRKKGSL